MFTSKDLSPMLGLMYLTRSHTPEDELSCCNAYKEIAFFSICAPMSLIHNVLSHCLQANSSLNHLLHCVICYVAFPKMVSPQYEFWCGFIDCFIEQMICNTVDKGPIFHFTSSSTPISSWTDTLSQSQACKGTTTRCPKNSFSPIQYFARK